MALPQNWFGFPTGRSGLIYNVAFASKSRVRVDLYIDVGDQDRNKTFFDWLEKDSAAIEEQIGTKLSWERLNDARGSRVAVYRAGAITDPPEKLAELRAWAVDMLSRFVKVFGPRIVDFRF